MRRVVSLVTTLLGVALLVILLRRVGVGTVAAGVAQVGWGFLAILVISGLRLLARAAAWRLCLDRPDASAVRVRDVFAAGLCAEALGSLTPLGVFASEPAKAAWVRDRIPFGRALAAVAIENVLYSISVAVMIAVGTIALLLSFNLPDALREASELSLGLMIVVLAALVIALWLAGRRLAVFGAMADRLPGAGSLGTRVRSLEARAHDAVTHTRGRLVPIALLEAGFHAGGVAEAYVTLWLLTGAAPSVLAAFVLETANRIVNVVFRFVPLRVGVDEAGSALITGVLGLGPAVGVTLAVVRKARVVCWSAAGVVLLLRKGIRVPSGTESPVPPARQ